MVAVYAAVLSTYREVQARRALKPKIKVQLITTMVLMDGDSSTPLMQVVVENHGAPALTFI